MIVGSGKKVESRIAQCRGKRIGCAEVGITRVGLSAQRTFEIHHGKVGIGDVAGKVDEARRIVVIAVGGACGSDLWAMLHGIAHKGESYGLAAGSEVQQRCEYRNSEDVFHAKSGCTRSAEKGG